MHWEYRWNIILLLVLGMPLCNFMLARETRKTDEKKELTNLQVVVTAKGSGQPVKGANVHVEWSEDEDSEDATTNKDGIAKLPNLARGQVLIQVTKDGWKNFGKHYDLDRTQQVIKVELVSETDR